MIIKFIKKMYILYFKQSILVWATVPHICELRYIAYWSVGTTSWQYYIYHAKLLEIYFVFYYTVQFIELWDAN